MAVKDASVKGLKSAQVLTPADYVHLHNHTQFSLLDGLTKIPDLVNFAKDSGMQAVAMTDHGTLSGTIEFYKECRAKDIKPIIGIETYVAARRHTDKDPQKDKSRFHLVLLAMNETGYRNLMKLSTVANLDGYYYFPRIDHELLEQYNEGLIATSACLGGEIGDALKNDDYDRAREIAKWYKSVFGDRYYLEVQDHGHPSAPSHIAEQKKLNDGVFKLAKELNIEVVLTCDAHYVKHEDQDAHEILLCVGTGAYLADEKRMSLKDYELHVIPPDQLIKRWGKEHPEVITNTRAIADRCNVTIELGNILIPKFPVPEGETEKSYLDTLVFQGLAWRYGGVSDAASKKLSVEAAQKTLPQHVLERAAYELGVVDSMGFNGYFLIVQDFINWGKNQGIIFGPGRGSAAGSIIAYAVRITDLDPLRYGLLFERFLNPDRISMPDIDVDIQDSRRDEVIQYCADKYGHDRVSNIVTFGRMFARNAVRDVARVLQVPYADADRLAKMIPAPVQGRHIPLAKSIVEDADLKREYETNETSKQVIDYAMILEGTVRSHGVHACGVVIAPDKLVKYVPLEQAQKGVVATQYPMTQIEELGLLKMDFLGLSNLTIIKNALRIIKRVYGDEINISTIPLDDAKTFELLGRGDTTGVFQFESAGMKRYLRDLKPTEFDDVIAMGALYRPGPLSAGLTDSFIKRKNGLEETAYAHPLMKQSLQTTYGVLVYQEQVMQISRDVCGFSGGEADTLRKAIGKKKLDVMNKMQVQFVEGAVKNGVERSLIEKFWKDLLGFADYCFNKSHSACYGLISYQTAYLKAHYPAAFMAALMTSDFDDTDRLSIEIAECKKMGIQVLPPDINESFGEFAVVKEKKQIRFGMNAVKNVGHGAVEEILRARESGSFTSIEDFAARVQTRVVNRKAIESLVRAGAFDVLNDRSTLLHNMDVIIAYGQRIQKERASGQTDIFGNLTDESVSARPSLKLLAPPQKHNPRELLLWERELLGLYLSQQPLAAFSAMLAEQTTPLSVLKPEHDGRSVVIGGSIVDIREITTKNGQKMAFVKIEDEFGDIEAILFPSSYQQTIGLWERDRIVLVRGRLSNRGRDGNPSDDVKLMVDDAREITHEQAAAYQTTGKKAHVPKPNKNAKLAPKAEPVAVTPPDPEEPPRPVRVYIRLHNSDDTQLLSTLKQLVDRSGGYHEVVLVLGPDAAKQAVKLPSRIHASEEVLQDLGELVGVENVKLQ
ncbi:DNA polymerase III subunit alpha [Candidatus Saccharibacteria bacterium]|nr:DNA polymerase III subunit alpha [Candidatus Saccharibacteria bacterium]